jgi:hypothetical protein
MTDVRKSSTQFFMVSSNSDRMEFIVPPSCLDWGAHLGTYSLNIGHYLLLSSLYFPYGGYQICHLPHDELSHWFQSNSPTIQSNLINPIPFLTPAVTC